MLVLTVAPLVNGIPYEELSYFSKDGISAGDLVEIPIRKRTVRGLVLHAAEAKEEKQSLRNASFGIKKISKVLIKEFLHPTLWESLSYSSSYILVPIGNLIKDLISEKSFEILSPLTAPLEGKGFEVLLLEQHYEHRITHYKTTIRELFSKKKSLVMFFPTIIDIEHSEKELSKGIEHYVVILHSGLTEKQYKDAQKKWTETEHPMLLLTTPSLLPWVRKDLGIVILEREHSHYYYTHGDNGYDMRLVIERLAEKSKIPCLFGSHMLSLRAHMLYTKKEALEVMPLQFRNDTDLLLLSMKGEEKTHTPYFSKTALRTLYTLTTEKKGHFFLYAHRKGMYPTTVCADCGSLYTCNKCSRPYILHRINGVRTYVCHSCENIVRIDEEQTLACDYCHGWRMTTLGIATGGTEEELTRLGIPTFVVDSDHTNTKVKVRKTIKAWKESPYGVLIGTEMAHNAIQECDGVIILSLDSLFSLPEYRTDEKILALVTEMSEKIKSKEFISTSKKVILQTRLSHMPVMKQLLSPSFKEVFKTLLEERERFLLPPYYVVIKASFINLTDSMRSKITDALEPYVVIWFEQGKGITLLFIHVQESHWGHNEEVRNKIKTIVYNNSPLVNPLHFFI